MRNKVFEEISESRIFSFDKSFWTNRENTTSVPRSLLLICVPIYRVFELVCRAKSTQERVRRILIEDASYVTAEVRRRKILHMVLQRLFSWILRSHASSQFLRVILAWLSLDYQVVKSNRYIDFKIVLFRCCWKRKKKLFLNIFLSCFRHFFDNGNLYNITITTICEICVYIHT